jgi:hypothetical protein
MPDVSIPFIPSIKFIAFENQTNKNKRIKRSIHRIIDEYPCRKVKIGFAKIYNIQKPRNICKINFDFEEESLISS